MTRFIPYLVAITISLYPARGPCSYLIQLKNGAQILTNQYWEEDGQIRFYYHGGIVGFYRDSVHEVIDSELPIEKELEEPKAPPEKDMPGAVGTSETKNQAGAKKQDKTGKGSKEKSDTEKKIEDSELEKKKNALMEKYFRMRAKLGKTIETGDRIAKEMAELKMSEILRKLSEIERKMKEEATEK